jgi:hypothetical protein
MTERHVASGEEMAAARGALGAVPAFAQLCAADPRRAAALAAACRVRVHAPGEVVVSSGGGGGGGGGDVVSTGRYGGGGADDGECDGDVDGEEEIIMVASGSLEVRPSKLNPFLAAPAATYAANQGDAIGEVAAAVAVLRTFQRRRHQHDPNPPPSPLLPPLQPRAPATVVCTSGPCRLFVLSSRDIHDVLLVAGPGQATTADAMIYNSETARALSQSVLLRLSELEAAAVTAAVGGGEAGL